MKYGFLKDKNGNKIYINDDSIYHEGKKLGEIIKAKQDKLIAGTGIEITGENIINNLNENYSTDEQIVGKWIDGKPLYRKVISHTITGNTQEHEPHNISNIERAISIEYSLKNQYGVFQTSDKTININMDTSQISIDSDWATGLIYIIVEYTKTTD